MNRKEHRKLAQRYLWARPEPLSFQGKLMKGYLHRNYAKRYFPTPPPRWEKFWDWYDRAFPWFLTACFCLMALAGVVSALTNG